MYELHRRPQGATLTDLATRLGHLSARTMQRYVAAMCEEAVGAPSPEWVNPASYDATAPEEP
jgi:hypothetical protein